jgi:hypothetical protein
MYETKVAVAGSSQEIQAWMIFFGQWLTRLTGASGVGVVGEAVSDEVHEFEFDLVLELVPETLPEVLPLRLTVPELVTETEFECELELDSLFDGDG